MISFIVTVLLLLLFVAEFLYCVKILIALLHLFTMKWRHYEPELFFFIVFNFDNQWHNQRQRTHFFSYYHLWNISSTPVKFAYLFSFPMLFYCRVQTEHGHWDHSWRFSRRSWSHILWLSVYIFWNIANKHFLAANKLWFQMLFLIFLYSSRWSSCI